MILPWLLGRWNQFLIKLYCGSFLFAQQFCLSSQYKVKATPAARLTALLFHPRWISASFISFTFGDFQEKLFYVRWNFPVDVPGLRSAATTVCVWPRCEARTRAPTPASQRTASGKLKPRATSKYTVRRKPVRVPGHSKLICTTRSFDIALIRSSGTNYKGPSALYFNQFSSESTSNGCCSALVEN